MSKQELNKDKELARLAGEVFEGAEPWVKWACWDCHFGWVWNENKPEEDIICWSSPTMFTRCQNQPVTDLPWTETLIRRSDYE